VRNIGLLSATPDPLLRQTKDCGGNWGDYHFSWANDSDVAFDACFIFDDVAEAQDIRCKRNNVFLVTWEPPSIKGYAPKFLSQFDGVLTFRSDLSHPGIRRTPPLLPWWAGTSGGHGKKIANLTIDDLSNLRFDEKQNSVSCVCSRKTLTDGHRKRLKFVMDLKEILGEKLEVFGLEYQEPWPDKITQIAPFQYHLAIENSSVDDYWTEKVADCFLGGAMLLYHGCPNLDQYFPNESFARVDFDSAQNTAAMIRELLAKDAYEKNKALVEQARHYVLFKYNLFAQLATFCDSLLETNGNLPAVPFVHRKVLPAYFFPTKQKLWERLRNRLSRIVRG
jgi:hypothetical protein